MAKTPYWGNGHYYEFVNASKTWSNAYTAAGNANDSNLGSDVYGYLAHPNDSSEWSFIYNYSNNGSSAKASAWLGGTDDASYGADEGIWIWVSWIKNNAYGPEYGDRFRANGTDSSYTNWSSGEPNNRNDEDYLGYFDNGTWNDFSSSSTLNYYVVEYGRPGSQYSVGLEGDPVNAIEDVQNGRFRVRANRWVSSDYYNIINGTPLVDIPLTFGGTAVFGTDYTVTYSNGYGDGGRVAYIINGDYVDINILPVSGSTWDASKSVTVSLGSDAQGIYSISGTSSQRLALWDDEPVLTLGQSLRKSVWIPYSRADAGLPDRSPDFVTFDDSINETQTSFAGEGLVESFGVRWEGFVQIPITGSYTFSTTADDGVKLYLDNALVINRWTDTAATTDNATAVSYVAGQWVKLRLDYYQGVGETSVSLKWTRPSSSGSSSTTTEVIPSSALSPVLPTSPTFHPASSGALQFSGADKLDLGNPSKFQLTTGTIEAWIKTTDAGSSYRSIITKDSAYGLFLRDNQLVAFDWAGGGEFSTGIYLNDGLWHHVALSFSHGVSNGSQIYVDGKAVGSAITYRISNNNTNVSIGGSAVSTQSFRGSIDEVRIWNTARSAADIASTAAWPLGDTNVDGSTSNDFSGLVGYYALDEASGSLIDKSVVSNGNTITSVPTSINRLTGTNILTPLNSGALQFNGTNNIGLGNASALQLSSGTIEAWIKTSAAGSEFRGVVVKDGAYALFLKNNVLVAYDWTLNAEISTGRSLNDSNWHHVALTFSHAVTNGSQIYIDGVAVGSPFTYKIKANATGVAIGGSSANTIQNFTGSIDEVRIWNSVRTATQIADSASLPVGNRNIDSVSTNNLSDLVRYYGFDERSGSLLDQSGTGNHLSPGLPSGISRVAGIAALSQSAGSLVATVPEGSNDQLYQAAQLLANRSYNSAINATTLISSTGDSSGSWETAPTFDNASRYALSFNGTASLSLSNPSKFQLTTGTIEAWIKTSDAGSSYRGIVTKANAYALFLKDNQLVAFSWAGGEFATGIVLNDGRWHHVALSFSNGVTNGSQIYVDGQAVGSAFTYAISANSSDATIGGSSNTTTQNFNGLIDEVRIWNTRRTATEIKNYSTYPIGKSEPSLPSSLVGYFALDEASGAPLDASASPATVSFPSSGVSRSGPVNAGTAAVGYAQQSDGITSRIGDDFRLYGSATDASSNSNALPYGINKISLPSGQISQDLFLRVLRDDYAEAAENISLSLIDDAYGNSSDRYSVVGGATTLKIADQALVVSVSGVSNPTEGSLGYVDLRFNNPVSSPAGLRLAYSFLTGTATTDSDFFGPKARMSSFSTDSGYTPQRLAYFPKDSTGGRLYLTGLEDAIAESLETISLQLDTNLTTNSNGFSFQNYNVDANNRVANLNLVDSGTYGAGLALTAAGRSGTAVARFDGSDDSFTLTWNEPETSISREIVFRTDQANVGLFQIGSGSAEYDRSLYLVDGNIASYVYQGETIKSNDLNLADNQWHRVVFSLGSQGSHRLYVDGRLVATGVRTSSDYTWQTAARLGYAAKASRPLFKGDIRSLRSWNSELSDDQVAGNPSALSPPSQWFDFNSNRMVDLAAPAGQLDTGFTTSGGLSTVATTTLQATSTNTASLQLKLTSQPTTTVTVAVSASGAKVASGSTLTFTSTNWETPQSISLGAVSTTSQATVTAIATSGDTKYSGLRTTLNVLPYSATGGNEVTLTEGGVLAPAIPMVSIGSVANGSEGDSGVSAGFSLGLSSPAPDQGLELLFSVAGTAISRDGTPGQDLKLIADRTYRPLVLTSSGAPQYLDLPATQTGGYGTSIGLTVEAWVNASAFNSTTNVNARVFDLADSDGSNAIQLGFDGSTGKPVFRLLRGSVECLKLVADNAITANQWVHLSAAIDANRLATLFVNGVAVKTGIATDLPRMKTRQVNRVGAAFDGSSLFDGSLRGLRVWNQARSQAQVGLDLLQDPNPAEPTLALSYGLNGALTGVVRQFENFDTNSGWTGASLNTSSAYYGNVLGFYANGSKSNVQDTSKTFALGGQASWITFDVARIDSWDGEEFRVYIDNVVVLRKTFTYDTAITASNGATNGYQWSLTPKDRPGLYAGAGWNDQTATVSLAIPAGKASIKLGFGSSLDQGTSDEAYAIDNFTIASDSTATNLEPFNTASGWTNGKVDSSSAYYGTVLGLYGTGTRSRGQDTWKSIPLNGLASVVSVDFARIDSWDTEYFRIYADDDLVFELPFRFDETIRATSGSTNGYAWLITPKDAAGPYVGADWWDQTATISIAIPAGKTTVKLGFGSSLDEASNNEAYAIDNLRVGNSLVVSISDDFTSATGWTNGAVSTASSYYGSMLGLYANETKTSSQDTSKRFILGGLATELRFDLARIDTWDSEAFRVYIDDAVVFEKSFSMAAMTADSGSNNGYSWTFTPKDGLGSYAGMSNYNDQTATIVIAIPAGKMTAKIGFGSSLNEATGNEAYAIDNLSLRTLSAPSLTGSPAFASTPIYSLLVDPGSQQIALPLVSQNDVLAEGPETLQLTLLPGAGYTVAAGASTSTYTLSDDDIASIVFAINTASSGQADSWSPLQSGDGVSVSESDKSESNVTRMGLRLSSQPSADVTISPVANVGTEVSLFAGGSSSSLGSLLFTSSNWSTYQLFDLQGQNDTIDDGNQSQTFSYITSSVDSQYNSKKVNLVVTNVDNDAAQDLDDAFANTASSSGPIASISANADASLSEATRGTQTVTIQLSSTATEDTQVFFGVRGLLSDQSPGHDFNIVSSTDTSIGLDRFVYTGYYSTNQTLSNYQQQSVDSDGINEDTTSFASLGLSEDFAVRWSGFVRAPYDGQYQFRVSTDDGSRLYIDGQLVIDKWFDQATNTYLSAPISFVAGSYHSLRYEYYQNGGGAASKLSWVRPTANGSGTATEVIPAANLRRNGVDYVTIARGSDRATFTVESVDDRESEGKSIVQVGLLANPKPQVIAMGELSTSNSGSFKIRLQLSASVMDSLLLKAGTVLSFGSSDSTPTSTVTAQLTVLEDTKVFRSDANAVKVSFAGTTPPTLQGMVAGLPGSSPYRTDVNVTTTSQFSGQGLLKQMYLNYTNKDVSLDSLDPTAVVIDVDGINDSETTTPGYTDGYAVRWIGTITIPTTGTYQFRSTVDDGGRLYLNGTLVIDQWPAGNASTAKTSTSFTFAQGDTVSLVYDFYEIAGGARAKLEWVRPSSSGTVITELLPASVCTAPGLAGQLNMQLVESSGVSAQLKAGDTLLFSGGSSAVVLSDINLSTSSSAVNVRLNAASNSTPTVLSGETSHVVVSRLAQITIQDDDIAGFVFSSDAAGQVPISSGSTLSLSEAQAGIPVTRYVALATQPNATVTLNLESGDPSEALLSTSTSLSTFQRLALTFTPSNWASPQAFQVTPVNDSIDDGTISFYLYASSSSDDPAYQRLRFSGSPATYGVLPIFSEDFSTISGWSTPTPANTSVDGTFLGVFSDDTNKSLNQDTSKTFAIASTAMRVEFSFLRFDSWDANERFQVFVNDSVVINEVFTQSSRTSPLSGTTNGISWTITPVSNFGHRNDIIFNDQTFDVVLYVPPLSDTFKLGFASTLDSSSTDESYGIDNLKIYAADGKAFAISTVNDDTAGVIASSTAGTTGEGANAFLSVSLSAQPSSDVKVTLQPSDGQFSLNDLNVYRSEQLTFTPSTWNLPQQVQLLAIDDDVVEATTRSQLSITTSSSDPIFSQLAVNPITVEVLDNDLPTARLQLLDDASEGGKPGSFQIVLDAPTATALGSTGLIINYTISAVSNVANDPAGGTPVSDSIDQIAQTPASSSGSVRIPPGRTTSTSFVVPIDDFVDDSTDKSFTLALASGSGYRLDSSSSTATFTIKDDDTAGFMIIESGDRTRVTEAGPSAQFQIVLLSQPTADVTITITDTSTKATGSTMDQLAFPAGTSGQYVFTSNNWYIPQVVNIIANDENVIEDGSGLLQYTGIHSGSLSYGFSSNDPNYSSTNKASTHFTKTIQNIDIVDRPLDPLTYQGLDESLTALQASLDSLALPMVGSLSGKTGVSIRAFLDDLVESVRKSGDLTTKKLQKLLGQALGYSTDTDIANHVNVSIDAANYDVRFSFAFDNTYRVFSVPLAADFGLPALSLQTTGSLDADFSYDARLAFGISKETKGFYLDVDPAKTFFSANYNSSLSSDFALTGGLGFLQIDAVNQPSVHDSNQLLDRSTDLNTDFTISLRAPAGQDNKMTVKELQATTPLELADFSVSGDAALSLGVTTSINGSAAIPSFSFDLASRLPLFNYSKQIEADQDANTADVFFDNITLDLGSFVTNLIKPVAASIDDILRPIYPVIDALYADTVIFSTLGIAVAFDGDDPDNRVSVIELAQWFANFYAQLNPGNQRALDLKTAVNSTVAFLDKAKGVIDLVSDLTAMSNDETIAIEYGSYTLAGVSAASTSDAKSTKTRTASSSSRTPPSSGRSPSTAASSSSSKFGSTYNKLKSLGFAIPIIDDPLQVINLFLGKNIDLFTWDLPTMGMGAEVDKTFPIYPGINGVIQGGFGIDAALGFGFDTDGLSRWSQDKFAPESAWKVFDGFYVADTHNGIDTPEFVLDASMAAGLGLNAVVVQANMLGGLAAAAALDLIDNGELSGTSDGKLRGSEIAAQSKSPLNLFEFTGELSAFLEATVKVGIDLGFMQYFETVWEEKLATIPIFEFGVGGSYSGGSGSAALSSPSAASTPAVASAARAFFIAPDAVAEAPTDSMVLAEATPEPMVLAEPAAEPITPADASSDSSVAVATPLLPPVATTTNLQRTIVIPNNIIDPTVPDYSRPIETIYFFDANRNGEIDRLEPSARSYALNFEPTLRVDHRTFDVNRDGSIDLDEGILIAHGNIQAVNNIALDVVYAAPLSAQVSGLSTFYTFARQAGYGDQAVRERLGILFNLAWDYDFLQRDAFAESSNNFEDEGFSPSEQAYAADLKLALLFHLVSQFAQAFEPTQSTVSSRLTLERELVLALFTDDFTHFDQAVPTVLGEFLEGYSFVPGAQVTALQSAAKQQLIKRFGSWIQEMNWAIEMKVPSFSLTRMSETVLRAIKDVENEINAYRIADDSGMAYVLGEEGKLAGSSLSNLRYEPAIRLLEEAQLDYDISVRYASVPAYVTDSGYKLLNVQMDPLSVHFDLALAPGQQASDVLLNLKPSINGLAFDRDMDSRADKSSSPAAYAINNLSSRLVSASYNPNSAQGIGFYDVNGDTIPDRAVVNLVDGGIHDLTPETAGNLQVDLAFGVVNADFQLSLHGDGLQVRGDGRGYARDSMDGDGAAFTSLRLIDRTPVQTDIGYVIRSSVDASPLTLQEIIDSGQRLFTSLPKEGLPSLDGLSFKSDLQLLNGQQINFFSLAQSSLTELRAASDPESLAAAHLRILQPELIEPTEKWYRDDPVAQRARFVSDDGLQFELQLQSEAPTLQSLIFRQPGDAPLLDFSLLSGEELDLSFSLRREASYESKLGFYRLANASGDVYRLDAVTGQMQQDASGAYLRVAPGDADYASMAMANRIAALDALPVPKNFETLDQQISLTGGRLLAPYAITHTGKQTFTYFAFGAANPDHLNHFRALSSTVIGFEDLPGLGDRDFDDAVMSVIAKPLNLPV